MRQLRIPALLVAIMVIALGTTLVWAQASTTLTIDIAPKVIHMNSQGGTFTVHGEIPLSRVDRNSIAMNGLYPYLVKADARGELVAKFDIDAVKRIVSPPETAMTFTGLTVDGTSFVGTATVRVRQ
ncbi:MAG: hypothetical protein GF341_08450 [candidate division Zixibacteria bacterium]|nr:hypothetical protein [candidate division Zixibacteria bacterium]